MKQIAAFLLVICATAIAGAQLVNPTEPIPPQQPTDAARPIARCLSKPGSTQFPELALNLIRKPSGMTILAGNGVEATRTGFLRRFTIGGVAQVQASWDVSTYTTRNGVYKSSDGDRIQFNQAVVYKSTRQVHIVIGGVAHSVPGCTIF